MLLSATYLTMGSFNLYFALNNEEIQEWILYLYQFAKAYCI